MIIISRDIYVANSASYIISQMNGDILICKHEIKAAKQTTDSKASVINCVCNLKLCSQNNGIVS